MCIYSQYASTYNELVRLLYVCIIIFPTYLNILVRARIYELRIQVITNERIELNIFDTLFFL